MHIARDFWLRPFTLGEIYRRRLDMGNPRTAVITMRSFDMPLNAPVPAREFWSRLDELARRYGIVIPSGRRSPSRSGEPQVSRAFQIFRLRDDVVHSALRPPSPGTVGYVLGPSFPTRALDLYLLVKRVARELGTDVPPVELPGYLLADGDSCLGIIPGGARRAAPAHYVFFYYLSRPLTSEELARVRQVAQRVFASERYMFPHPFRSPWDMVAPGWREKIRAEWPSRHQGGTAPPLSEEELEKQVRRKLTWLGLPRQLQRWIELRDVRQRTVAGFHILEVVFRVLTPAFSRFYRWPLFGHLKEYEPSPRDRVRELWDDLLAAFRAAVPQVGWGNPLEPGEPREGTAPSEPRGELPPPPPGASPEPGGQLPPPPPGVSPEPGGQLPPPPPVASPSAERGEEGKPLAPVVGLLALGLLYVLLTRRGS